MNKCFLVATLMLSVMIAPAFAQPGAPAPVPTEPADEVISLFTNVYDNEVVDTWSADWDMADVEDYQVQGDDTKLYTNLVFAGIEFATQPLDVSTSEYFHMDIWTPEPTDLPAVFKIKLVDFGPNGVYDGGGDDSEHELTFDANSGLATGEWVSFDILMDSFSGLNNRTSMAQLIISGDLPTIYVDNIFWYGVDDGVDPEPDAPAPTPTEDPASVISLFSNPYNDVFVDTWSADWDMADVEDIQIEGNDTKLYTNAIFGGIEFTSEPIDATDMTHFRMDIWFPGPMQIGDVYKIKLVDFGPDGMFDGGDDTEHELTFHDATDPPLVPEQWIRFDIPLDDFVNMTGRTAIAQLIFVSDPGANTIYMDNVYFYNETLDVEEELAATPVDYALMSVYPNPFNPTATVQLTLPQRAEIEVSIHNSLGRQVASLAAGSKSAGTHTLTFDGSAHASGMYLVRATVNGQPLNVQKLMLLK